MPFHLRKRKDTVLEMPSFCQQRKQLPPCEIQVIIAAALHKASQANSTQICSQLLVKALEFASEQWYLQFTFVSEETLLVVT
eukprot:m.340130 g.340130  ORF g.340130 m.340130 type:complete len:82 (+) comp20591_c0_seq5:4784-5029(+)